MAKPPAQPKNFLPELPVNPNLKVGGFDTGIRQSSYPNELISVDLEQVPSAYRNNFVSVPSSKNLTAKQLQYQQAETQSALGNITKGLWNTTVAFGAGVASLPGTVMNVGTLFTNNPNARLGDGWLDFIDSTKEALSPKLYLTENDEAGNVWTKLTSSAYFGSTIADTVGNMASYFVPGAALKAVNIGGKITRLLKAGDTTKVSGLANSINSATAVTANTLIESLAEGRDSYSSIKEALYRDRASGANAYSDEKIEELASAGATSVSRGNIIPLLISNLVFDKLFFSGASTLGKRSVDDVVQASINNSAEKLKTTLLSGFKLSSPTEMAKNLVGLKGSPKGFWYRNMLIGAGVEGYWEENLQTALQRTVQERALLGEKTDLTNLDNIQDILDKSYGKQFNDEQLEAVVLGGLLGFGMSVPSTIRDVKSYNAQYVGREAYTPSKIARAFGAKAKPKVDGLVSAVTGIRTGGIGSLTPEQFKEAFVNEKGKLDEEKLTKALNQEENSAIRYTAMKLTSYKDREVQLANATDENRDALMRQFAAEDILDSMMPLLMHEQGGEIFAQIVDEMVQNKGKALQESTGIKTSLTESKQYAESLKQLGTQLNKTALRIVKNHNNIIPNYGAVKEAEKLDKIMYDQALLHKRIITAVHEDLLKEKLDSEEGALKALRDRAYQIEQTVKSFEAEQTDLIRLEKEKEDLQNNVLPKLRNQDAINTVIAEESVGVDADGNPVKMSIAEAQSILAARKTEANDRLTAINEILNSTESKELLKNINKNREDLKVANSAIEDLIAKSDETKNLLGGTYVPEKYKDEDFVAAFSGRTFKGINDLNKALFDPKFVDEDFKNYVRNKRLQDAKFEKQQDIKKIKSKFFKVLFDRATIGADVVTVKMLDSEGKQVEEKRNFYYSAKFQIKVLNSSRSGFEARKLTSNDGVVLAGESMRLVAHEPATDTEVEHLVFKEENYTVDDEGNIVQGPEILYKLYADGRLQLVSGPRILNTFDQFEYKITSAGLSEITPDSDIDIVNEDTFNKEIEEHQAFILKTALDAQFRKLKSTKQYSKKSNPVIFDNLATTILEEVIASRQPQDTEVKDVAAFRLLREEIIAINKILQDIKTVSDATIKSLKKKGFTKAVELIIAKDVEKLEAYLNELKLNFDAVQDDFNKAYNDVSEFLTKTILDQTAVIQDTLKQLDTLADERRAAAISHSEAIAELKKLKTGVLPEPLMEKFVKQFGSQFAKESDRKALTEFINIMTSGKSDDEIKDAILELATSDEYANSSFAQSLYADFDSPTFDPNTYLDSLSGLNFIEAKEGLTRQEEAIGFIDVQIKDFFEAWNKANEAVGNFAKANSTILKFFNPKTGELYKPIYRQKQLMAYELYQGQDGNTATGYADPMTDDRASYELRSKLHKPVYQPGYGLLRTAGSFNDFYSKLKFILSDIFGVAPEQVTKTLEQQIAEGNFSYEQIENYLVNTGRQDELYLLDQWRYYAFMQSEDIVKRGLGAAYVTAKNIKSLPDFVQQQVRFFVPDGRMLTISEIEQAGISIDSITDIKALVVRKPKDFASNAQSEKAYYLDNDYQNKVIYMSIRDYSDSAVADIAFSYDTRGVNDPGVRMAEDIKYHKAFRDSVLAETTVTTAHAFSLKTPGAVVDLNKQSYVEVMDALEEGAVLSTDLFEFPVYKTKEDVEKQREANVAKYGLNLPTGFMFLKTNGSLTVVKPKTLTEANMTNRVFSLLQALVSDDVSETDKKGIYNYLKSALRLRKDSNFKDPFFVRINVDPTTGKLKLIEFQNFSITGDTLAMASYSEVNSLRASLGQLNHNINHSKFAKNAPFVEYTSYNPETKELKSVKHDSYLDYLFNPKNGSATKGQLFDYAKIRGVNKMVRPFVIPRRDAYAYLKTPEVPKVTVSKVAKSSSKLSLNPLLATKTSQVASITVATPKLETQKTSTYSDAISDGNFIVTVNFSDGKFSFVRDVKSISGLGEGDMVVTVSTNDFLTKSNTFVNIIGVTPEGQFIVRELTTTPGNQAVVQKTVTLEQLNDLVSSETLINSFGAKLNNGGQALTTLVTLHEQKDAENLAAVEKQAKEQAQPTAVTTQYNVGDVVTLQSGEDAKIMSLVPGQPAVRVKFTNGTIRIIDAANIVSLSNKPTTEQQEPEAAEQTPIVTLADGMTLQNAKGSVYTVIVVDGKFKLKDKSGKILSYNEKQILSKIQSGALTETSAAATQVEEQPAPQLTTPTNAMGIDENALNTVLSQISTGVIADALEKFDALLTVSGITEPQALFILEQLDKGVSIKDIIEQCNL